MMNHSNQDKRILEGVAILDRELRVFVNKYRLYKFLSKEDVEDMRSSCIVEIIQTINRFDETKNVKLQTFLCPRIVGFFKDYLSKENKITSINSDDLIDIITPQIDQIIELDERHAEEYYRNLKIDDSVIKDLLSESYLDERVIPVHIFEEIMTMPKSRMYIILSFYMLNKGIKEIAEELGISPVSGWAYKLRNKALTILKEKLIQKGIIVYE